MDAFSVWTKCSGYAIKSRTAKRFLFIRTALNIILFLEFDTFYNVVLSVLQSTNISVFALAFLYPKNAHTFSTEH